MRKWPFQLSGNDAFPGFIPLSHRMALATSGMLILLLGVLTITLGWFQNHTIRQQLEQRGKALGQSLAATATKALLNYDYITLEQFANQAAQDPNILYVIVHDKEDRVAGYSNRPDLQGRIITDETSLIAVAAAKPLVQQIRLSADTGSGLEVATPVYIANSEDRWGTVRVCLSLAPLYQQMRQTIRIILAIGLVALGVGIGLSILEARRVTKPLENLVQATMEVAKGNLEQNLNVKTGDEVEVLATNFSVMTKEILRHQERQERQFKEIQRLQNYTENLMITMADGLLSVDISGTVAAVNPAACDLLGISSHSSIKGKPLASILEESSQLRVLIDNMLQVPAAISQQEVEIGDETETRTILVGASPLYDSDKRPREIIFTLHNITELKKLESRIRQSERLAALGTLAAGMAHEIRNPLSAIKTFVQLLPRKIDNPIFLEKFNRTVPRETNRINLLVEELLELSRFPRYSFSITDVNWLLKQTNEAIESELYESNIEYQADMESSLPKIQADANQLLKAFHNLARNAIQAMPTGGLLTIRTAFEKLSESEQQEQTATSPDRVIIIFEDTGEGISPDQLTQIFNPFFTTKDTGTGLGLPITHKVITEHRGQIEVESQIGQGTKVTVSLPVYSKVGTGNI